MVRKPRLDEKCLDDGGGGGVSGVLVVMAGAMVQW